MKIEELPEVESVAVAKVGPDDVIVLESEGPITTEVADRIKAYAESFFPGRKVVVLCGGLKLSIVSDASKLLQVGDSMRMSSQFLRELVALPDFTSARVRVREIETEEDGTKTLWMENDGTR